MKVKNNIISKNKNGGITLIALVITIIVLLILAGVTVASLTGENGLLERAKKAKEETAEGQAKEEVTIAWNGVQIDGKINGWDNTRKAQELQTELGNGATATVDGTDNNRINITYKGYDIVIDTEEGTVTIENSSITIAEFKIEGTLVAEASIPVPSGFTYKEGTKDTGYVIENNTTGDQFVWVPVDKDQKIYINVTSEEAITSIVLTNPVGEEKTVGNESGTRYTVDPSSFTKTYNGVYRLVVTTSSTTKKEYLYVHSLYAQDTQNDWRYGTDATDEELFEDWLGDYSEPADTIDYEDKVATNGGFYIGRYEATYGASGALSKAGTSTRTSSSTTLTEGMLWNCISQTDALSTAKGYNTSLKSSLLTGAAWDRTLGWIYETGNKTASKIAIDSKDWGNYYDDTFSGTTGLINTGAFTQTKANNIYDLAGNVSEWTTEANYTSSRVRRGGRCYDYGSNIPASYRNYYSPSYTSNYIGFRLALYL